MDPAERRQFRRVSVPIRSRPIGRALVGWREDAQDASRGGLRIYTNEAPKTGEAFDVELTLPNGETIHCQVAVVWVAQMLPGAPAKFDAGLKFLNPEDPRLERLQAVLEPAT